MRHLFSIVCIHKLEKENTFGGEIELGSITIIIHIFIMCQDMNNHIGEILPTEYPRKEPS